ARLETFAPPAMSRIGLDGASGVTKLAVSLALNLTIGTLLSAISAAGEEFGWRGYMLTRLIDAGLSRPLLVSGLVWSLWHVPLIVSGQYAAGPYPTLSAILFVVSTTAGGYIIARVRLESGSVWPAVLFHASWNAVMQGTFDVFTARHASALWTGESGIVLVVV